MLNTARAVSVVAFLALAVGGAGTVIALVNFAQGSRWCVEGGTAGRPAQIAVNTAGDKVCRVREAGRDGADLDVPLPSPLPLGLLTLTTLLAGTAWGLNVYTNRDTPHQ